ncbi:MAG: hypothetical protein DME00_14590 [Candidatus Rokuibacteriota bacterium]|nr:MAG: hypothetical protein DME00_14590 [Candidatus Rokubacteria bacterium]PYO11960.1 MAG: hypothetical protein DMD75_08970 [Candidatus Rokubacteria bacterium]TME92029.1 MAG: hypothetical protein E6I34_09470 [Chloroflexota bacterium]
MVDLERLRSVMTLSVCLALGACSLSPVPPPTLPSGVTQQLLIRSLERALSQLDIARLKSQTVTVEVFHHAGPEALIKEFVVTWLRAQGVRTVSESPDLKVKAFASVLGTDNDQTLLGIPAFQAPVVNVPVPEIAIFKWQRNRGVAELRLYEFDGKTDAIVHAPPIATGRAKLDKYTVLLFIGFTWSDVDDHD